MLFVSELFEAAKFQAFHRVLLSLAIGANACILGQNPW